MEPDISINLDTSAWITLGVIGVLLMCSAFFNGAETAVTAASRPRLHRLAQLGSRRARAVNRLRERQDRLIGALLLGGTVVNIAASALATSVLIALVGENGVAYATLAMTILIVVFGEVLPKTYAIYRPVRTALAVAPTVAVIVTVLAPVTRAIEAIVSAILKRMGVRLEGRLSRESIEEELRGTIEMHAEATPEEGEARLMLHSVLDLGELDLADVMTHRKDVYAIEADAPPETIVAEILESPHTRIPLWRSTNDNIVGILNVKTALKAMRAHGGGAPPLDLAAHAAPPWFIPDSTSLLDQLKAFRAQREHFAVVVDEYGAYEGIVTLEDIVEEIVGEIFDEQETPVAGVRPQPDGSHVVRGSVAVRDLNRQFGWRLPEDEAATIAGLLLRESRVIPESGQVFEFYGFRFEVLRRQRNQITSVRIRPPQEFRGGRPQSGAGAPAANPAMPAHSAASG